MLRIPLAARRGAASVHYASGMSADTPEQLAGLERAGRVVAETLRVLRRAVAPGITTEKLDRLASGVFASFGARSGPILTYGYPGSVCISVDDEVVHGIPGDRVLSAGELVSLDVAAELDGYHADAAVTVPVGAADRRAPAARPRPRRLDGAHRRRRAERSRRAHDHGGREWAGGADRRCAGVIG
jgi:methionine aminopeptidase